MTTHVEQSAFNSNGPTDTTETDRPTYAPTDLNTVKAQAELSPPTVTVRLARVAIRHTMQEYLTAAAYLRAIGAQTPSAEYGGSRSMTYMQMLSRANTIAELRLAREQYKGRHHEEDSNHDEYGGLLRIAAYRLQSVPLLGVRLEQKVRSDDALMAQASFDYPEDCIRYSAPLNHVDETIL